MRVEFTLASEKLNQKHQEWESMSKRLEEAERGRTHATTEAAKYRVENEELRR